MWKPVPGYEGLYEVSDCGLIRSLERQRRGHKSTFRVGDRLLKAQMVGGYLMVRLYKQRGNGVAWEAKTVHRLVAEAFLPNPANLPVVNHLDGVKANCAAANLEWTTHSENIRHAYASGLKIAKRGSDHAMARLNESQVVEIKARLRAGESQRLIGLAYGVGRGAIRDIKLGKSWAHLAP